MKLKIFVFLFALLFAGVSSAADEANKVLTRVGVQGGNAYFKVEGGFAEACLYDTVYVPATTTFGKFAYAGLLTAFALEQPVGRIVYAKNTSDVCVLTLLNL